MVKIYKLVDFDKVCVECGFCVTGVSKEHHRCSRPVDIITGKPTPTRCINERSSYGNCAPKGKYFSAGLAVENIKNKAAE